MKLKGGVTTEHIRRMTRRATNTGPLTAPEELTTFMNAMQRCDYDDEACEEECDKLERVLTESVQLSHFYDLR